MVKHDPGHKEPEGPVWPDPLLGDCPHLDLGVHPEVGLDDATGLLIDGHQQGEARYRVGVQWE